MKQYGSVRRLIFLWQEPYGDEGKGDMSSQEPYGYEERVICLGMNTSLCQDWNIQL